MEYAYFYDAVAHSQLYRKRVRNMPQVRVKKSAKTADPIKSVDAFRKPVADVHSLISRILKYEETAREHNVDFTASRFKMLTASEKDYIRAELVADFIRLTAGNTGRTPVFFDSSLFNFCSKICDLGLASTELMGTYLASLEVSKEDMLSKKISGFDGLLKKTMLAVLQTCVEMLANKTNTSIIVPKRNVRPTLP